ncbi:hypothetical protein [Mycolicibacterium sp. XJ870]
MSADKVSVVLAVAVMALGVGCAGDEQPAAASEGTTTTAASDPYPGGPLETVFVPDPKFTGGIEILRVTVPHWAVIEDHESPSTRGWIGYPAGGNLDLPLRFDVAFDGTIEDLKPPIDGACYHHGDPPYPALSVDDITAQTGDGKPSRKMGDRTADYRVWHANCPQETVPEIHQAWLLPDDNIAIYEQRATEYNNAVVESVQVLR